MDEIDLTDFDALQKQFRPLIESVINRHYHHNKPYERADLEQEALIALSRATLLWRNDKGITFGAYLKKSIENRLKMYLRDKLPHYYAKDDKTNQSIYHPVAVQSLDAYLQNNEEI